MTGRSPRQRSPLGAGTLRFRLIDGGREAEPVVLAGGGGNWRLPPERERSAPIALEAGQRARVDPR